MVVLRHAAFQRLPAAAFRLLSGLRSRWAWVVTSCALGLAVVANLMQADDWPSWSVVGPASVLNKARWFDSETYMWFS